MEIKLKRDDKSMFSLRLAEKPDGLYISRAKFNPVLLLVTVAAMGILALYMFTHGYEEKYPWYPYVYVVIFLAACPPVIMYKRGHIRLAEDFMVVGKFVGQDKLAKEDIEAVEEWSQGEPVRLKLKGGQDYQMPGNYNGGQLADIITQWLEGKAG
ncbi:hypothetical protein LJB86_04150 [Deltaproteobacteria bacterium OttesenSCG-928-M10]|nr:hypothetical protein [Deltaproteobacteria bacterium OttesenSCG-928-M10]